MTNGNNYLSHGSAGQPVSARGMTLVEVVVSMTVLTTVMLVVAMVLHTTSDNLGFELTAVDQQVMTRSTVDSLMDEFRLIRAGVADFDTRKKSPSDPYGRSNNTVSGADATAGTLIFCVPRYDMGTKTLELGDASTAITYRWALNPRETSDNDGVDNDGNGLIDTDDGQIERQVGTDTFFQVILDHVPQDGFIVRKVGPRLEVTVARKNNTNIQTSEGTYFTTTITQITYSLKNP